MMTLNKRVILPVMLLLAAVPRVAGAQEAAFAPVMMPYDGTDALTYPPAPALDIAGAGTIELWARAKWTQDPGYDPALLSIQGPKGPRLAMLITRDARALGVYAGPFYDTVPFDFSDGQLHHIALILIGDQISVMIDGEVRDTLGFGMADLPADTFSVGSLGEYSPFIGEIGQVRVWDEPLDPETLVAFSWKPLASDGPDKHPDIAALTGVSAFANPETGGFVFFGTDQAANVTTAADDPPIDDSGLGLDDPALNTPD